MPSLPESVSKAIEIVCDSLSVTHTSPQAEPKTRDASSMLYLILYYAFSHIPSRRWEQEDYCYPIVQIEELRH